MKALKIVTVMALAFGLSTAHAVDKAQVTADKSAVKSACAEEAKTAGCGDETVGTGLLKCFHAYKKAHKDFKPSQSCKYSIGKVKEDHKEMKAKREEKKEEMKK